MLKIRLARVGKKKRPSYRFVVSDSTKDTYGKALEILGHYNPFSKVTEIDKDRTLYWIGKGAQPSPTVHNMLVDQNVLTADKVKASKPGKKKPAEAEAPVAPATAVVEKPAEVVAVAPTPVVEETPAEVKVAEPEVAVATKEADAAELKVETVAEEKEAV
ncbi:MAG: 30S ribosomal protein S16 [Patescibacteria group bacterium]|nr:30S ribosomal protein S16 [Patescibacteria group bacterium]